MKCVVPSSNLKVLGRAIHSLAKVGDEIYFEFKDDGLSIGTVNSSRCAYMNFNFKTTFFQKYSSFGRKDVGSEKCKIYTKSCLAVFKTLSSLERAVDKCVIMLDLERDRFIFQLHCINGLMKTYNLTFIESEKLDAIYNIEDYPNYIIVHSKLFTEVVNNFQQNIEELSLQLFCNRVVVTNQIVESDVSNALRTEVELLSDEFDELSITSEGQVIFCLKEFRALLFFCEGPELQFAIHVKNPGEPAVFIVDSDQTFDVCLILATVSPESYSELTSTNSLQTSISEKRVNKSSSKSKDRTKRKEKSKYTEKVLCDVPAVHQLEGQLILDCQQSVTQVEGPFLIKRASGLKRKAASIDHKNYTEVQMQGIKSSSSKTKRATIFQSSTSDNEDIGSVYDPVNEENDVNKKTRKESYDGDDVVPGTPPSEPPNKRFRTLFLGISQSQESLPTQNNKIEYEVLAENSEDE